MFVRDDIWLWESQLRAEVFEETYAHSAGVVLRRFDYSAIVPLSQPASVSSAVRAWSARHSPADLSDP